MDLNPRTPFSFYFSTATRLKIQDFSEIDDDIVCDR